MSFMEDLRRELGEAKVHAAPPGEETRRIEFTKFEESKKPMDMAAVDGSYSFLLNIEAWWLASIVVGMLRYSFSGEHFAKKDWRMAQRVVSVSTHEPYVQSQGELLKFLYESTRGAKEQHREMVNEWRKFIEGQLTVNVAEGSERCIIAVDGALSTVPKKFNSIERLVDICEKKGHLLVGVSKDSKLHAFGSAMTDEGLLKKQEAEVEGSMAFVRAPEEFERRQKDLLHGDVYYCKFNPRSMKWFRVDLGTMRDEPEKAFGQIAPYCRSLLAVGYPFPLIEAHRMAVTVRRLRGVHQERVVRQAVRMGMDPREVIGGLTEMEGRKRSAFHEYLDRLARDRR